VHPSDVAIGIFLLVYARGAITLLNLTIWWRASDLPPGVARNQRTTYPTLGTPSAVLNLKSRRCSAAML
jgi:hypothetical protein